MKKVKINCIHQKNGRISLKDWSSTLDVGILFVKRPCFLNILHLSKPDWFSRSKIIIFIPSLSSCHCNIFYNEWPAQKSVSVLQKETDHVNIWNNWNAASGYKSISENEWPSVCKFAQKHFSWCEVSPYSNFQLYGLLQFSLSELCRFIQQ